MRWVITAARYLWDRRTTAFGYFVVFLGVVATSDVLPVRILKYLLLSNGLITAGIGHYNNSKLKRQRAP